VYPGLFWFFLAFTVAMHNPWSLQQETTPLRIAGIVHDTRSLVHPKPPARGDVMRHKKSVILLKWAFSKADGSIGATGFRTSGRPMLR
jgi:hypothetical protein